jgi:hypothetical protein
MTLDSVTEVLVGMAPDMMMMMMIVSECLGRCECLLLLLLLLLLLVGSFSGSRKKAGSFP